MTKVSIKHSHLPKVMMKVKKVHPKSSRLYESQELFDSLMEFALLNDGTSINSFVRAREKISKTSFLRYFLKSGLADLKQNGTFDAGIAKVLLTKYFEDTKHNASERTASAHASCHYLTENQEHSLVRLCTVLGCMGYGLTRNDIHNFADQIVNKNVDERVRVPISKHVTEGLLTRYSNLVKIVAASSLDPKRARQATEEARDAMFFKLNSNIKMLHALGDLPWKQYSDIPAEFIYNMDEIGNDTTKHRNKVLYKKQMQTLKKQTQQGLSCEHQRAMDACHGMSWSAL